MTLKGPNNSTIFDIARRKSRERYKILSTDDYQEANALESIDINNINYLEEQASADFKNGIICKTECFWKYILTKEDRTAFGIGLGIFVVILLIQIFSIGELSPKQWFYKFLKNIFSSAFYCFIVLAINFVISLFKRNVRSKSRAFYICWILTFVLFLPHIPVVLGYETNRIGAFYEANNYTAKYYVIMSQESNRKTNRKAYTLPAEIERREDYLGSNTYNSSTYYLDGETYESDIYALNYHINYLYFPNGGYLFFAHDESYDNPECSTVVLNKETRVTDYHGDDYYITLTSKRVQ